ncbi:MAG: response regulator, partial [Oscillospiraceae bacterium]
MSLDKTMLIVDDAQINRKILMKIFENDYSILEADNGAKALKIMEEYKQKLSVVLLDIRMPEMDGFEVLKKIQENSELKKIPLIAVTSEESSEVDALTCGAWDFISKPIHPEIVKIRIENAVKRKQLADMTMRYSEINAKAQILQYLNDMPVAFYVLKTDNLTEIEPANLIVDYCNKQFGIILNKKVSDIIGRSILEILPADEILFTKIYTDIIIEGRQYTVEKSSHDLSKRYYANYFYSPRRGYCACMIQDITEIRRLEKKNIESLEKSNRLLKERNEEQERYEIITKQTGSIVFEWNFEKKMFYCSENFQEFENGATEMQKRFITEPNLESIHDDD